MDETQAKSEALLAIETINVDIMQRLSLRDLEAQGPYLEYTFDGFVEKVTFCGQILWTSEFGYPKVEETDEPVPLETFFRMLIQSMVAGIVTLDQLKPGEVA